METIALTDAQARLAELLTRVAGGETFEITDNGRPVAQLSPPIIHGPPRDRKAAQEAAEELKAMIGFGGRMTQEERKAMVHEGHRY